MPGAAGLALVASPYPGLSLIALVVSTAFLLPAASWLAACWWSVPALAAALCCWLTAASVLHVAVQPAVPVATALVVTALTAVAQRRSARPLARAADLPPVALAVASFLIAARPFWNATTGSAMTYLSRTTDAANHLQMVRAVMRYDGYFALVPGLDDNSTRVAQHYPPGLAGVVGTPLDLVLGHEPSVHQFVIAGAIGFAALFAVTVFVLTAWGLTVVESAGQARGSRTAGGLVMVPLVLVGPAALLFSDAAYAQLLASVGVIVAIWAVATLRAHPAGASALVVLGSVLALQSWYLVAAALLLPWLRLLGWLGFKKTLGLGVLATPFCLFPVLLSPGGNHVTTLGFIDLPDHRSNVALTLGAFVALFVVTYLHPSREDRTPLLATCVAALLTSVVIGFVQLTMTGFLSYYFFKTLMGAALFATVLVGVAFALVVRPHAGSRSLSVATRVVLGLLLAAPATSFAASAGMRAVLVGHPPEPVIPPVHKGHVLMPLSAQTRLLDAVFTDFPRGVSSRHDVWVGGDCVGPQEYILAKWIYDTTLTWTARRQQMIGSYRLPSKDLPTEIAERAAQPSVDAVDVYTSAACPQLSYGTSPKIHLHVVPAR